MKPGEIVENRFREVYGREPELLARAPGRVNLIGEHTDYNDGFVFPCAIGFETAIAAVRRDDNRVRVVAVDFGDDRDEFSFTGSIKFEPSRMWPNYIRGVVDVLQARNMMPQGADLVVSGDVPQGAGLSSSASLEMALLESFRALFDLPLSDSEMALIGQQAENDFVGCSCGVMDQMISMGGREGQAMLLDCRSLAVELVSLPVETAIVIVNSNIQRGLVDSAYNERREQCERAARALGHPALRDASMDELSRGAGLMDEVTFKRARHVISENERTLEAVGVLQQGDLAAMGRLMAASHLSMRDDFEITVPEIDYLVETIADVIGDTGGVRMTGGGFGGCVVALVPQDRVDEVSKTVEQNYFSKTGLSPSIYRTVPEEGACHQWMMR